MGTVRSRRDLFETSRCDCYKSSRSLSETSCRICEELVVASRGDIERAQAERIGATQDAAASVWERWDRSIAEATAVLFVIEVLRPGFAKFGYYRP